MNILRNLLISLAALAVGAAIGLGFFMLQQKGFANLATAQPTATPEATAQTTLASASAARYHPNGTDVALQLPTGWLAVEDTVTIPGIAQAVGRAVLVQKSGTQTAQPTGVSVYTLPAGQADSPAVAKLRGFLAGGWQLISSTPRTYQSLEGAQLTLNEQTVGTTYLVIASLSTGPATSAQLTSLVASAQPEPTASVSPSPLPSISGTGTSLLTASPTSTP